MLDISCPTTTDAGTIEGGNPGKDKSTILFSNCVVETNAGVPLTESECNVKGSTDTEANMITVTNAKTELVYTGNQTEAEEERGPIGDLFSPASGGTFVTLKFAGTNCPGGFTGNYAVTGTVVGEVENPEVYLHRSSSEPGNMLNFPAIPITKSYKWTGSGTVTKVTDGLKIFGVEAVQTGKETVELDPKCVPNATEGACEYEEGGVKYWHLIKWGVKELARIVH